MTIKPTNAVTPVKQNLYPKSAYDKLNKKKKRRALYGGRYVEYLSERLGDPDLSNSYEHVMDALIEFDEYLYYYAMEAKRSDEKKALSKKLQHAYDVIKDKIRQKGIQSRTLAHLLAGIDEAMQEL